MWSLWAREVRRDAESDGERRGFEVKEVWMRKKGGVE